jgi:ATP-binding cassette subfamily B (MDR/TAP) protein 1
LFNDTVYNNILNGLIGTPLENVGEQEKMALVVDAAKAANAHEFIEQLSEVCHVT